MLFCVLFIVLSLDRGTFCVDTFVYLTMRLCICDAYMKTEVPLDLTSEVDDDRVCVSTSTAVVPVKSLEIGFRKCKVCGGAV